VQLAEAPVPDSKQLPLRVPVLLWVRAKVAVGVIGAPGELSVTVTLQVEAVLITTGVVQETVVVVVRRLTTILVAPLLVACEMSPG
jgi:hypothetical protein